MLSHLAENSKADRIPLTDFVLKSRVTTQAAGERNFVIFYERLKQCAQFSELDLIE